MSSQLGQIFVLLEQIEAGTLALPPLRPSWLGVRRVLAILLDTCPIYWCLLLLLSQPPPLAHPFYFLSYALPCGPVVPAWHMLIRLALFVSSLNRKLESTESRLKSCQGSQCG